MNRMEYDAPTMEVIKFDLVTTNDVIWASGRFGSTDGETDDEW